MNIYIDSAATLLTSLLAAPSNEYYWKIIDSTKPTPVALMDFGTKNLPTGVTTLTSAFADGEYILRYSTSA